MALEPTKHVNGRMWPPGISGNPNGRPVGSRTAFSQGFLKDLTEMWADRGRAAMEKTAQDQPGVFFATCARLFMRPFLEEIPFGSGHGGIEVSASACSVVLPFKCQPAKGVGKTSFRIAPDCLIEISDGPVEIAFL
jgi:hypothetical protein